MDGMVETLAALGLFAAIAIFVLLFVLLAGWVNHKIEQWDKEEGDD